MAESVANGRIKRLNDGNERPLTLAEQMMEAQLGRCQRNEKAVDIHNIISCEENDENLSSAQLSVASTSRSKS